MSGSPQMSTTPPGAVEEVRPPSTEVGVLGWLYHNLFSSKLNGLLTIVLGVIVALVIVGLAQWIVFEARWAVITSNMRLFLVGRYPPEEIWRVWVTLTLLSAATGVSAGSSAIGSVRMLANMLMAGQLMVAALIFVSGLPRPSLAGAGAGRGRGRGAGHDAGRGPPPRPATVDLTALAGCRHLQGVLLLAGLGEATPLPSVSSSLWGGLLLTIVLAIVGIMPRSRWASPWRSAASHLPVVSTSRSPTSNSSAPSR